MCDVRSVNNACNEYFSPRQLWNQDGVAGKAKAISAVLSYFTIVIPGIVFAVERCTAKCLQGRVRNLNGQLNVRLRENLKFETVVVNPKIGRAGNTTEPQNGSSKREYTPSYHGTRKYYDQRLREPHKKDEG